MGDVTVFLHKVLAAACDARLPFLPADKRWLPDLVEYGMSRASVGGLVALSTDSDDAPLLKKAELFALHLGETIVECSATQQELNYVTTLPDDNDGTTLRSPLMVWEEMARRLLHMYAYWLKGKREIRRAPFHLLKRFPMMEVPNAFDFARRQLVRNFTLDPLGCDTSFDHMRLEDYAKAHAVRGTTYFPARSELRFVATKGQVDALITRNVPMSEVASVTQAIIDASAARPSVTTIAFSGETGSGKTVAAFFQAMRCGLPIYTTADELGLCDIKDKDVQTDDILSLVLDKFLLKNFPVQRPSSCSVAVLVIDELGGCPRVARELCKTVFHESLASALMVKKVILLASGSTTHWPSVGRCPAHTFTFARRPLLMCAPHTNVRRNCGSWSLRTLGWRRWRLACLPRRCGCRRTRGAALC